MVCYENGDPSPISVEILIVAIQMPGYHGSLVLRSPLVNQPGIQTTVIIPVCYSDVIQNLNSEPFE